MRFLFFTILVFIHGLVISDDWSGYDWENGSYVDITDGSLVRPGNDIEIYDWSSGEYLDVEVESINGYGSSVEVEVYDWDSGEYRTLDMD